MGRPAGSRNKKRGPVPKQKLLHALLTKDHSNLTKSAKKNLLYDTLHVYEGVKNLKCRKSIAGVSKTISFLQKKTNRNPSYKMVSAQKPFTAIRTQTTRPAIISVRLAERK